MSVTSSWWLLLTRGSHVLEKSPSFHPHQAAWFVLCMVSVTVSAVWVIACAFLVLLCSLHLCLGCSAETYLVLVQCTHLVLGLQLPVECEFVAVEASVDSSCFNVVSGVAVPASEEYTISFIVECTYLVMEGDDYGAVSTLSKVPHATSIRGGSASLFFLIHCSCGVQFQILLGMSVFPGRCVCRRVG